MLNRSCKNILRLVCLVFLFGLESANAQVDYSSLNFYRENGLCIGCKVFVYVDDVLVRDLENKTHLEYQVFNLKETRIVITDNKSFRDEVVLDLRKGDQYHFYVKARLPRSLGFKLEYLENGKKYADLKKVEQSDIGKIVSDIKNAIPDTQWFKTNLMKHWEKNGIKGYEGIYEGGVSRDITCAVVLDEGEYKVIYLDGLRGSNWREGDLLTVLEKTGQKGYYKSIWRDLSKSKEYKAYITFINAFMRINTDDRGVSKMGDLVRMYPAYEENEVSVEASEYDSSGTGFFVDKRGYIVTNYHVVEGEKEIVITVDKIDYKGKIISIDQSNDLVIIKIDDSNFSSINDIEYNYKNDLVDVGTSVFTLGFPLTNYMGTEIKFTDGKISARSGFKGDIREYQISVPIQAGNSGGPLFDIDGNLIGITNARLDRSLADNVNYAIKLRYLSMLIEESGVDIKLPNKSISNQLSLSDKIRVLSKYVVLIRVKK